MEDSQIEGAEEDFNRWMKEARDFELGITNKPPLIFAEDSTPEEKETKLAALARWLWGK